MTVTNVVNGYCAYFVLLISAQCPCFSNSLNFTVHIIILFSIYTFVHLHLLTEGTLQMYSIQMKETLGMNGCAINKFAFFLFFNNRLMCLLLCSTPLEINGCINGN